MREGGRREGRGREGRFSPSALSLFRFYLSLFPPETPDTQARRIITTSVVRHFKKSSFELPQLQCKTCLQLKLIIYLNKKIS